MTSVEFVEKALIGSLLNDSNRRAEVTWLHVEDFTNPLCAAVWRHLESGNPPACQPLVDLVEMSELLGRVYELHPRLRSPAELATLQFQAHERPVVGEYGRILIEATIRREVAAIGLRLESLANGEPEQIIDGVANALAAIEGLDQRWQVSTGRRGPVDPNQRNVRFPLAAEGSSPPIGSCSESPAAANYDMDHQMAENAIIGAAVHDWPPGARAHVLENVRASDFTDSRASATWLAVKRLEEYDAPIDEVTVAWQTMRARSQFGDGLTVQELRETRGAVLFHEMGAATLARLTITRVASGAQAATSRCAEDLAVDVATVIDSVAIHHVALAAAAERLTRARFPNASLATVQKRLLDRTCRSPVPTVTTYAMRQPQGSHCTDSKSTWISS